MNILRRINFHYKSYPIKNIQISSFNTSNLVGDINIHNLNESRSVLRVQGAGIAQFLQGLITNDINHLDTNSNNNNINNTTNSIYSMFLNKPGKVLYDTILYKNQKGIYFIDCDRSVNADLKQHLQFFRVRKKIDIDIIDNDVNIWFLFNQNNPIDTDALITSLNVNENFIVTGDPRVKSLGVRLILPTSITIDDIQKLLPNYKVIQSDTSEYKQYRYRLGIGEGVNELPIGKIFPLEANCDYLHGVSFHKGCYLGQEFTARTYHTGVVRKRLMPLKLHAANKVADKLDTEIYVQDERQQIGKLRGVSHTDAIGLVRIDKAVGKILTIEGVTCTTSKPKWWPTEAPKDLKN